MSLGKLVALQKKTVSSLVAVTGRRRIGKSRLLEEYGRGFDRIYVFSGLAPTDGVSAQDQRNEFVLRLSKYFGWPEFKKNNWTEIFSLLAEQVPEGSVLVVLDEISWMASGDKLFLAQLKNAWDLEFKKNPNLVLALCGSVSTWVTKNILNSTGFVGRISETIHLEELDFRASEQFWGENKGRISSQEKLKLLSIIGGVPRYLEEIIPSETAENNIHRMCFSSSGFLYSEFEKLFSDLFATKQSEYKKILLAVAERSQFRKDLVKNGESEGGSLTARLNELCGLGFLSKDYSWSISRGTHTSSNKYRLSDNYTRFYLKYLYPYKREIKEGIFPKTGINYIPGWDTIMGLQFENLIIKNSSSTLNKLGLDPRDIVQSGPFFQKKTKCQPGTQIDLLVQTRFKNLFVCEVKNSINEIGYEIIEEVKLKLKKIKKTRDYTLRPVLISAGPVSLRVKGERFFDKIIEGDDLF